MKSKIQIISCCVLLLALVTGCEKNVISYGDSSLVKPEEALLKINYASLYAQNPSVQIKINGARVSPLMVGRTTFPGGGYNTNGDSRPDYLVVNQGEIKLTIAIPNRGTNTDSVVLYNSVFNVESGKNYTAHITDTAANTQTVLLTDEFARPDSNFSKFKFVNLIPNLPGVDLYFGTNLVAGNIPYKGVSNAFTLAVPGSTVAWSIRPAGAAPASTALATYSNTSVNLNQRVYTAFAIEYSGLTDVVRKPYISFLFNR